MDIFRTFHNTLPFSSVHLLTNDWNYETGYYHNSITGRLTPTSVQYKRKNTKSALLFA